MSLSEQIDSDFARVVSMQDEFAKPALYTKYRTGETLNTTVVMENLQYRDVYSGGRSINDNAVAFISLDFEPSVYDQIAVEGEAWKVSSFAKNGGGYRLEVTKDDGSTHKHTHGRFR